MVVGFGVMFYAWLEASATTKGTKPSFYFSCIPWIAFILFFGWFLGADIEGKKEIVQAIADMLRNGNVVTVLQSLFYVTGSLYFFRGRR